MKALRILSPLLTLSTAPGTAAIVYTMDGNALFEHDSDGVNSPVPLPSAGSGPVASTGTFSWGDLATDSSTNFAEFSGTTFTASDWGGEGTFTSTTIDVSGTTSATITANGSSTFNNAPSEFFTFFYQLDGSGPTSFASAENPVIDLTGVDTLEVGFAFNHNGASDNVIVTGLSVETIPEPATALLGGLALLGLLRRR